MDGILEGLFVVLMTPLNDAGSQDEKSLGRMLDYYVDAHVRGFTVLAESSERDRLSDSEKEANLRIVFDKLQGKFPIVVGTGRESTRLTIEESQRAESRGAAALMISPPRNPKLRDQAIFDFYAAVGDSVGVPLVIQDFPQNDRPYMSPELIARVHREVKNAQYLKLEDAPTPIKLEKVKGLVGDKLKIFGALYGRDAFWELDQGAVGIMTATATPEYLVSMLDEFRRGNRSRALDIYLYSLPLTYFLADVGIAVRKEILVRRGVIQTAKMKQPASELTTSARRQLAETLGWVERRMIEIVGVKPHRVVSRVPP
jgi:4-hydroxy-tetrahydrodipicolinate synthase